MLIIGADIQYSEALTRLRNRVPAGVDDKPMTVRISILSREVSKPATNLESMHAIAAFICTALHIVDTYNHMLTISAH